MKKTKIIATIGPASGRTETLVEMIQAGMNVARLNFSHGTYASHATLIKNIRAAAGHAHKQVAILQDLSGPKLRLGEFHDKVFKKGQHVVLGQHGIPVGQPIWQWIKPGQTILIDDGLVELIATNVHEDGVEAKVVVPGLIKSHKGVSLPGVQVKLPALSEKDLADLEFGMAMNVDFIAMSFVKSAHDITNLRQKIKKLTKRYIPIVAKIETPEALKNIDQIIEASDVIMVARGDLALNISQSLVPIAQKNIVKKCLHYNRPVIVATQMLDSMIHSPRPTRAEISDVANAVLDHVDCVMLSGESAFGAYPVKTVDTMAKICESTEDSPLDDYHHSDRLEHHADKELVQAHNLIHFAVHAKINALIVSDLALARGLSHFRPGFKIILATANEHQAKMASVLWGVTAVMIKGNIHGVLKHHDLVKPGDRIMDATKAHHEALIELIR
jgi:pyruvate kinase